MDTPSLNNDYITANTKLLHVIKSKNAKRDRINVTDIIVSARNPILNLRTYVLLQIVVPLRQGL